MTSDAAFSSCLFECLFVGIASSSTWRSRDALCRDVVSQAAALEPAAFARWRTHHCACVYKVRRSACWLRALGFQPRGGERKLRWVISVTHGLTWRLSAEVTLPPLPFYFCSDEQRPFRPALNNGLTSFFSHRRTTALCHIWVSTIQKCHSPFFTLCFW